MINMLESNQPSSARILLVEDDDAGRQLMSDYLESYGYKILGLPKGSGFALAMNQFRPDLVLLDLKLPDIDGYALLQQRQRHPDWLKVPVIVISALAFQADQQRALKLGACQYVIKPINLTQLKQTIRQQLSGQLVEPLV
jgi:DNA-binding response OmpR family regulator